MKVYVLRECIDSSDFYAESNVIMLSKGKERAKTKMFELYMKSRTSFTPSEISEDESWCENSEASVVTNTSGGYYRHYWKIDEFEV